MNDNLTFNLISILVPVGGLAIFAILTNFLLYRTISDEKRRADAASKWPSVTGTVLTSRLEAHRRSRHGPVNYPSVHYSYEVNGKPYKGNRISAGGEIGGLGVESVIVRYPVGAQVTVFYDPQDPKDAVLEQTSRVQSPLWIILFVVDIVLCVVAPLLITFGVLSGSR